MAYISTKYYGFEQGFSVAYRQWRADSHCNKLHGYALAFKLTFACIDLDARNWVVDFGSLRPVKEVLAQNFDHTLLVASDDPKLAELKALGTMGLANVVELEHLGSEQIAKLIFDYVKDWLVTDGGYGNRVWLQRVEVWETPANSAAYEELDMPVLDTASVNNPNES